MDKVTNIILCLKLLGVGSKNIIFVLLDISGITGKTN